MSPTPINHANRLTDFARKRGISTDDLAGFVIDAATEKAVRRGSKVGPKRRTIIQTEAMWQAHEINATGYFPQISYLIDCYGPEETSRLLKVMAGDFAESKAA